MKARLAESRLHELLESAKKGKIILAAARACTAVTSRETASGG
jgi:hypothetical protein